MSQTHGKMLVTNLYRARKTCNGPKGEWRAPAHRRERRVNRNLLRKLGADYEVRRIQFTAWDWG